MSEKGKYGEREIERESMREIESEKGKYGDREREIE